MEVYVAEVTGSEQSNVCWIDHSLIGVALRGVTAICRTCFRLAMPWVMMIVVSVKLSFACLHYQVEGCLPFWTLMLGYLLRATLLNSLKAENLQTLCRGLWVVEVTNSGHFECLLDPNLHWRCKFGNHCNVRMNALSLLTLDCGGLRISFTATLTFFDCTPRDRWLSFLLA
jgi:hypothetical protein